MDAQEIIGYIINLLLFFNNSKFLSVETLRSPLCFFCETFRFSTTEHALLD